MKSLPTKYFGPSGLPCVFASDDSGTPLVGYLKKQLSEYKFIVTDGDVVKVVKLAQTSEEVATYTTQLPVNTFTILLQALSGPIEHVRKITYDHCVTIDGTRIFQWHNDDPNEEFHGIVIPDLTPVELEWRLLEDGSAWLLEDGSNWLLERSLTPIYLLLEDGGYLLYEDDTSILLENYSLP